MLADDVHQAFELAEKIQEKEGRYLVQPFEGPKIALGTGTLMVTADAATEVLVVGAGAAGLCAALSARQDGAEVEPLLAQATGLEDEEDGGDPCEATAQQRAQVTAEERCEFTHRAASMHRRPAPTAKTV